MNFHQKQHLRISQKKMTDTYDGMRNEFLHHNKKYQKLIIRN